MINTLLLGSKGNLGKYIYSNSNELDLNIFTHKDKDISKVLKIDIRKAEAEKLKFIYV